METPVGLSEDAVVSQSKPPRKRPRVAEQNRSRAAKACDGCRRLKEKCEGGKPCQRCLRSQRVCKFSSSDSVNGYMTNHESSSNDERTKHLERIVTHFLGDVSLTTANLRGIVEKIQTKHSAREDHDSQSDVNDLEDLTLEDENFTVKTLSHNTARQQAQTTLDCFIDANISKDYSGEFSHWNFSQKVRRKVDEVLNPIVAEDIRCSMGIKEYFRATQLQSPASTVYAVLNILPPREVAGFLTQIFFRFVETNFFYVKESWLQEKLDILYSSPTDISTNDAGWICAVLMVLAIGTQYAHMDSGPSVISSPSRPLGGDTSPSEPDVGMPLYHMATTLLPDVITIASLESVQACLLLALYAMPLDTQGLAYTYVGLTIKMAIQNGMHRKYNGQGFNSETVEMRNRLWWTAYTLERRISVLHGRPASISPGDVDADLPVDLPEFRSSYQPNKFENMSALIYLTIRLGDISHAITLLRRCPKRQQPIYFQRLLEIRRQIHEWWTTLPSTNKFIETSPTSPLFRPIVHLRLCFHLNEIFMGRPFILFELKNPSPTASGNSDMNGTSPATSPPSNRAANRAALVSDAVTAALEVFNLCQMLDEHCGLARASYTEFSSCRAALLVILAQSLNERSDGLRNALALGMRLLKKMALSIDSAKSELSVIEALETAIRRLDGAETVGKNYKEPSNSEITGYDRYRSWAMLWAGDKGASVTQSPPLAQPSQDVEVEAHPESVLAGERTTANAVMDHSQAMMYDMVPVGREVSTYGIDEAFSNFPLQADVLTDYDWQTGFVGMDVLGTGLDFPPEIP